MLGNKFFPEGYTSLEQQHWKLAEEQQSEINRNAEYPLETAESNLNVNFTFISQF